MEPRNTSPLVQNDSNSNLNFSEIKTLLDSYLTYLFQHLKYLSRIEKGLIQPENIKDYFYEIYGFTSEKLSSENFIKEIIPKIKSAVQTRLEVYACLVKAATIKDQDQAICVLNILLEQEKLYESYYKKVFKSKEVSLQNKLEIAFRDDVFVMQLHNSLQPLLPKCYSDLAKVIKTKEERFSPDRNKEYVVSLSYNWTNIARDLKDKVITDAKKLISQKELKQKISSAYKNKKNIKRNMRSEISNVDKIFSNAQQEAMENLQEVICLISARQAENKAQASSINTENDFFLLLEKNIKTFFKVYPLIDVTLKASKKASDEASIELTISKKYNDYNDFVNNKKTNFINKIKNIEKTLESLVKQTREVGLYNADLENNLKAYQIEIHTIHQEVLRITLQNADQIKSEDQINILQTQLQQTFHHISDKLFDIKNTIAFYHSQIEELKENQKKKFEEEQAATNAQNENYYREQQQKLEAYKNKIKEERQKKKLTNISTPKPMFFTEQKVVQYENVDMKSLLMNLNSKNIEILRSILNLEAVVTFDNVYSLTTALGGKILNVGNGSSHRRIVIDKYIVTIVDNSDDSPFNEKNIPSVATGGFFQQHGKAHTERTLCRFNLEFIRDTFIKAGLMLEVLNTLRPFQLSS